MILKNTLRFFYFKIFSSGKKWIFSRFQLTYWFNSNNKSWHLIYKTSILYNEFENWMVYIDARTGLVLKYLKTQCSFHAEDGPCAPINNIEYLENCSKFNLQYHSSDFALAGRRNYHCEGFGWSRSNNQCLA